MYGGYAVSIFAIVGNPARASMHALRLAAYSDAIHVIWDTNNARLGRSAFERKIRRLHFSDPCSASSGHVPQCVCRTIFAALKYCFYRYLAPKNICWSNCLRNPLCDPEIPRSTPSKILSQQMTLHGVHYRISYYSRFANHGNSNKRRLLKRLIV